MMSARSRLSRCIPVLLLLSIPATAPSQVPAPQGTNVEALRDLSIRFESELAAMRPALYDRLLRRTAGAQGILNADPNIRLQFIAPNGMPMYVETHNLNAARTLSVDDVWPGGGSGFALGGAGTTLGKLAVWDAGAVRLTHQEFGGRASQMDGATTTHYHATHVAGTMIASGVVASAKGMSFQGTLACYEWNNDQSEMASAAAGGMNVSNHSYGYSAGWYYSSGTWYWYGDVTVSETEDFGFGYYDDIARGWDEIAHNAPYYTIVKSAGNERDDAGPGPGGGHYYWNPNSNNWEWSTATRDPDGGTTGYDCVSWNGNAKNILSIGAVQDIPGGYSAPGDVVVADFSSWGPTDDGRIKPDFVANGISLYSTDNSGNAEYRSLSGTSMSSPNASGTLNLLIRYYETSHGATPRAATMKAVLMETSDEAGTAAGPDYPFGWGLINAKKAAQLIQADSSQTGRVREESLANGETDDFFFTLGSVAPVRLSIAWTDPPGTSPAPAVDPPDLMLVNDLDMRLERIGGSTYSPYVLNPASPAAAATTGDNFRDNAEQIVVASAPAGDYRVRITHKGSLASPQAYSIASTHDLATGAPPPVPVVFASDTSYSHVYVEWGAAAGADSYEVKRDDAVLARVGASVLSWRDTVAAGTYVYSVAAGNEYGWSAYGSDGGTVLAVPPNWVDIASGPLAASDSTLGAAWGDSDGDGDPDLFLANRGSPDILARNDGGVFADATAAPLGGSGLGAGAAWGDYDNDGVLDLYVANDGPNALYRGLGGGLFEDATEGVLGDAGNCRSAPWGDFEGDRRLDLFLVNRGSADRLLRNEAPGPFADATAVPLGDAGNGSAAAWADYDNDGDPDIYLTHETIGASRLYRNDGHGVFSDATAGPLAGEAAGAMAVWGDYDNDGDLDLYRVGIAAGTSALLRNDGGAFVAVVGGPSNSFPGRSAAWGDVDNDGDLDLYLGCDGPNRLLRNDGAGVFVEVEAEALGDAGDAGSVSFGDVDGDGDLDLLVANAGGPDRLFRNDTATGNRWAHVTLVGTASNRAAIGTRLRLVAGGAAQIREISGGEGSGQGSLAAEFGLGAATFVDSLTIHWPSGYVQVVTGLAANAFHQIVEDPLSTGIEGTASPPLTYGLFPNAPNPFNPATRISFEIPTAGRVEIAVFDVTGRVVSVLEDGFRPAGRHDVGWDGRDGEGRSLPSGVYFARMTAGGFGEVRKLLLVR
jgi:hypothetical protein